MARSGIEALSDERGTGLFDRALASGEPLALALPLNRAALRSLASAGALPALFRGLVRVSGRRAEGGESSFAVRLPEAEESARLELVTELVARRSRPSSAQPLRRSASTGPFRSRLRLARRGRAAQPTRGRDGTGAAGDGRLRPPLLRRPGLLSARSDRRRRWRRPRRDGAEPAGGDPRVGCRGRPRSRRDRRPAAGAAGLLRSRSVDGSKRPLQHGRVRFRRGADAAHRQQDHLQGLRWPTSNSSAHI